MSNNESSPVLLYLSRHGQTFSNLNEESGNAQTLDIKALPFCQDLTETGKAQALILAQYAGLFIFDGFRKNECGVLSSSDQRSIDTANIILRYNRMPHYRKSPLLREEIPKEFITPPADAPQSYLEWHTRLRPKAVLAERFSSELEHYIRTMGCKAIVAPLHGNMNAVFLEHIGLKPFLMDNCSILPLRYEAGRFTQNGDYLTIDDMKTFLEK